MSYEIEMLNITKDFPGIRANDNVTLQVKKGTIHALLGENGAGKSTLMSILFGLYQADQGTIKVRGEKVSISSPNDAADLGIGMVHQHFKLVDDFTVAENIILGNEPRTPFFTIDMDKVVEDITEISETYKLKVDPLAKIEDISVGMQQRVEILKMLYRNADILIFDEPTAVLTPQEIDELMLIMKGLVEDGKTIILITHKLNEIMAVADECTVLRRGQYIDTVSIKETNERALAELMVGRAVDFNVDKEKQACGDVALSVRNLFVDDFRGLPAVNNLSLDVHCGEIVGLAGIDGNGQEELIQAISGLTDIKSGEVFVNGKNITDLPIKEKLNAGMGHIPSDRHKHGLVLDFMLQENMIIHDYEHKFSKNGILQPQAVRSYTDRLIEEFDVRSGEGADSITRSMSGGNQQKAIIAREIDRGPEVLLVVQPTRGLDVGAIEYIHARIVEERNQGKAILLVSFELDEILALSDKIAVIYNGEITGFVDADQTNENELGLMMAGAHQGVKKNE